MKWVIVKKTFNNSATEWWMQQQQMLQRFRVFLWGTRPRRSWPYQSNFPASIYIDQRRSVSKSCVTSSAVLAESGAATAALLVDRLRSELNAWPGDPPESLTDGSSMVWKLKAAAGSGVDAVAGRSSPWLTEPLLPSSQQEQKPFMLFLTSSSFSALWAVNQILSTGTS